MSPVELLPVPGGSFVLRARGSELLILNNHVAALKKLQAAKDFAGYFTSEALINRPARKLFEAWLRKDAELWRKIYNYVHKEADLSSMDAGEDSKPKAEKVVAEKSKSETSKAKKVEVASKSEKVEKKEKVEAKVTTSKVEKSSKDKDKKETKASAASSKKTPAKAAKAKAEPAKAAKKESTPKKKAATAKTKKK